MKNLKFFKLIVFLISISYYSCSEDIESLDTETTPENTFQTFLKDNDFSDATIIVQDGNLYKVSELKEDSEFSKVMSLYNDAYSIHQDGNHVFLYTESQSLQPNFDEIDDFVFNNIESSLDKADNPVWFTFNLYKGTNFTGSRLRFNIRKNAVQGFLLFDRALYRLNRLRGGDFNNNISSLTILRTEAGRSSGSLLEISLSDSASVRDEFLGFVSNGLTFGSTDINNDNVIIPNLGRLNFSMDREIDPRGVFSNRILPRNNTVTSWDNLITIIEIVSS